ncbi:long-chain fatty acid--CoA ligase [Bradymonadaceae bacterium TMQ3]|nr:long-chain fatty acid--CoA ligase [Bradymonadaceae bacterium TMQ3]TXC77823.1 long-chain fatty acid--CoA ligase [Bradymonadales bacterium TMQ1]
MSELQPTVDLLTALAEHAAHRPHAIAWRADEPRGSATWREWAGIVERLSALIVKAGVRPGTTVGYRGTNHPIAWSLALACARVGASFWPLNYRWSARELGLALEALPFEISALIVEGDASASTHEAITRAFGENPTLRARMMDRDALWADGVCDRSQYETVRRPSGATVHQNDDLNAPWIIMSTGGTTGLPKQVAHTRWTLAHNARQFLEMTQLRADEPVLVVAPNFHVAGFSALTAAAIATGAPLQIASRFKPGELLQSIGRGEVRSAVMVPTMWRALFDATRRYKTTLSPLRFGICGGAPMPPSYFDEARTLGFELLQGYGMTEAGPMVTLMPPLTLEADDPRRASAGIPPRDVDVWIESPQGRRLPAGKSGQIVVRGPQLATAYLGESSDSSKPFRGDVYLTGDFGHLDNQGFLYIEGRLDDVIITGGENVAPAEVESRLVEHPEVSQAAVLGVADPHWGQKIVALMCPARPAQPPTPSALIEHLRPQLAGYKLPRDLRFCDTLPLTSAGKIDRPALVKLWQSLAT